MGLHSLILWIFVPINITQISIGLLTRWTLFILSPTTWSFCTVLILMMMISIAQPTSAGISPWFRWHNDSLGTRRFSLRTIFRTVIKKMYSSLGGSAAVYRALAVQIWKWNHRTTSDHIHSGTFEIGDKRLQFFRDGEKNLCSDITPDTTRLGTKDILGTK